jgi:hypothetical protein
MFTSQVIRFAYDPSRKKTIFNSISSMFFSPPTAKSEQGQQDPKQQQGTVQQGTLLVENFGELKLERAQSGSSVSSESSQVDENSVKRLVDMGFAAGAARDTLIKFNGNETAAINELLKTA